MDHRVARAGSTSLPPRGHSPRAVVRTAILTAVWTFLVCVIAGPMGTWAQDDGDLQTRIAATIERYGQGSLERAWQGATALESFGENAIPSVRRLLMGGNATQKLMAAKTLVALGATEKVGRSLRKIAEDSSLEEPQRAAALRLLAGFPGSDTKKLLTTFLEGEGAYDATLRIEAAKTLFATSRDRLARSSLMPLLDVDDPAVRTSAALALGDMGYVEGRCHQILQGLSQEPTARGAQARLIINNERLMQRLMAEGARKDTSEQNRHIAQLERELEQRQDEIDDLKKSFKRDDTFPLISSLLDKIEKLYADPGRVDRERLLIEAAKGMVASLDPFSSFMDPKDTSSFDEGISGAYAGIGAQVAKNRDDHTLEILKPIYKGPAYRLGLRSSDKITEVEGLLTQEADLDDLVKKLKGAPGTSVNIMVHRRGWKESKPFTITRETINLDSVHYRMLPGNLGYVKLLQFGDTAVDEFDRAVDELEAQGMKGLIFDLRNNPGGYLTAAVAIVDQFVGEREQPIVSQRGNSQAYEPSERFATAPKRDGYPVVVVVNRASASASEIVSGALQDFKRATVVGERTFGKGSIQRLLPMPTPVNDALGGRSVLRLTVQYYYLPSGRTIHAKRDADGQVLEGHEGGVIPDIEVEPEHIPLWRLEAIARILETEVIEEYLDQHFEKNAAAFERVADLGDGGTHAPYPDFEEFFSSRNPSKADLDDIRWELRSQIRRRVQDIRGREFACDFPDDPQLQRAILATLEKLGQTAKDVPEYGPFAHRFDDQGKKKDDDG